MNQSEKGVSPREYAQDARFTIIRSVYTTAVSGIAVGLGGAVAASGEGRVVGIAAVVLGGAGIVASAREGIKTIRLEAQDIYGIGYSDGQNNREKVKAEPSSRPLLKTIFRRA